MRPQLRKLLKEKDCLKLLNCTANNLAVMKHRGYLSKRYADGVEWRSGGKYKARLLVK